MDLTDTRLPSHLTHPPMTEKQLQAAVVELAGWLGYLTYHTFDSRRSEPGYPDLCLVREPGKGQPRLIYVELKAERGIVRDQQKRWASALLYSGAEVYTWKPAHLLDGTIERILTAGRPKNGL